MSYTYLNALGKAQKFTLRNEEELHAPKGIDRRVCPMPSLVFDTTNEVAALWAAYDDWLEIRGVRGPARTAPAD